MNLQNQSVNKIGYWSAVLAAIFSLIYVAGQLAEWFGWLGSGGGPENASTVAGLIILLTPSLLLGPSFLVMMISLYFLVGEEQKIWMAIGVAFAVIYTTLISINYYVQLTLVVPHMIKGETESIRFLLFTPFDSFLYSVDILGYSFMSLATLFGAFAFSKNGLEKPTRSFFLANGVILPFIALQNYYHPLIWVASAWAITFPGATICVARLIRNDTNYGR